MKILILDYSGENKLKSLLPAGHTVIMEQSDGMNAYRVAGEWLPDIILVNGEARPSHNRQTLQAIQRRKKTSTIPVYIVMDKQIASEEPGLTIRRIRTRDINRLFMGEKPLPIDINDSQLPARDEPGNKVSGFKGKVKISSKNKAEKKK